MEKTGQKGDRDKEKMQIRKQKGTRKIRTREIKEMNKQNKEGNK